MAFLSGATGRLIRCRQDARTARRAPLSARSSGPPPSSSSSRKRTSSNEGEENDFSWRDQARRIFEGDVSADTRTLMLFDLLKQSPRIARELSSDSTVASQIEGLGTVARQLVTDILPEIGQRASNVTPDDVSKQISNNLQNLRDGLSSMGSTPPPSVDSLMSEVGNAFRSTPEGLETLKYDVLYSDVEYEIRRYDKYTVAETAMRASESAEASQVEANAAREQGRGFQVLARYLFGGNDQRTSMSMTTPVIIDRRKSASERMSFLLTSDYSVGTAPLPDSAQVSVKEVDAAVVAARRFPGFATEGEVGRQVSALRQALERDNVQLKSEDERYQLLQYNAPYTAPWVRRNEILLAVTWPDS